MIPKRSRRRVTPVLRFVEGAQLSLKRHHYSVGVNDPEAPPSAKRGPGPVTNQVTTPTNYDRRSRTQPDKAVAPTCPNTTPRDAAGRNRQAWHARGQGFESPKLHQVKDLLDPDQDHPGAKRGASRELSS
jgi:hypothetical protein